MGARAAGKFSLKVIDPISKSMTYQGSHRKDSIRSIGPACSQLCCASFKADILMVMK